MHAHTRAHTQNTQNTHSYMHTQNKAKLVAAVFSHTYVATHVSNWNACMQTTQVLWVGVAIGKPPGSRISAPHITHKRTHKANEHTVRRKCLTGENFDEFVVSKLPRQNFPYQYFTFQ